MVQGMGIRGIPLQEMIIETDHILQEIMGGSGTVCE